MIVSDTKIEGVKVIEPRIFEDERGYFFVSHHSSDFSSLVSNHIFVQDNCSKSHRGVLRGLHYQVAKPQGKLIRVTSGEIFDVVVDMRPGSSTLGLYLSVYLSSENKRELWVPPGFAHGFLALANDTEVMYKVTDYWDPASERTLIYNDPIVGIEWPEHYDSGELILSKKDMQGLSFLDAMSEIKEV